MKADFVLPVDMADQIDQIVADLRRMTEAECVLLADVSGQLISVHGRIQESDPVLVAALAAGDAAAMAELSRQIGEGSPYGTFLHEGKDKSIYLSNVAGSLILIVIFRAETLIGLVRLFAGRAAKRLQALAPDFEEILGQSGEAPTTDFGAALADELETAFGGL